MVKKCAGIVVWIVAAMLFIPACGMGPEKRIQGLWKAQFVTEGSDTLAVDISTIQLEFKPEGRYSYTGNLNYTESGVYHIKDHYLYTTDDSTHIEKVVEILTLDADTLVLHMEENVLDRVLRLVRQQ